LKDKLLTSWKDLVGEVPKLKEEIVNAYSNGLTDGLDSQIATMRAKVVATEKKWFIQLIDILDAHYVQSLPPNAGETEDTEGVVEGDVLTELFRLSKMGCRDASQFADEITRFRAYYTRDQILNREWRFKEDQTSTGKFNEIRPPGELDQMNDIWQFEQKAASVYRQLEAAKSGVCTTFAWAAASLLLTQMKMANSKVKRVEVVGWFFSGQGHNYVLVNRESEPDFVGERKMGFNRPPLKLLPAEYSAWGEKVIVIDPWHGTLGNPYLLYRDIGNTFTITTVSEKGTGRSMNTSLFDSKAF
jgi:hypothetical protein